MPDGVEFEIEKVVPDTKNAPRFTWLTLEAQEIIELKQAMLDRDSQEAADFFWRVIVPRVREAAQRRGISLEEVEAENGRISG
jgi:hypothetical protein